MGLIERKKCPICKWQNFNLLLSIPYTTPFIEKLLAEHSDGTITRDELENSNYEIVKCKKCEFVFQKFIPDNDLSDRLYLKEKSRAESLSKKQRSSIDNYIREAKLVEKISILLRKNPGEINVLEFGSGWGYFLLMLKAHGYKAQGIEILQARVDYSREIGLLVEFSIKDLGNKKYDFIHSDQTFEHLDEPVEHLRDLSSLLTDNGMIYIGVPNCRKPLKNISLAKSEIMPELIPLGHINCFTNKSLNSLAKKAGLAIVSPSEILSALISKAQLFSNGQFFQEAIKSFYTQKAGTNLYFRKV